MKLSPLEFFSVVIAFEILSPEVVLEMSFPCFLLIEMEVNIALLSLHLTFSSSTVSSPGCPFCLSLHSAVGCLNRVVRSPFTDVTLLLRLDECFRLYC